MTETARTPQENPTYKALTLTQPWATLIAVGAKRVETRSWTTDYRGPIAIHAAKGFPKWAKDLVWTEPFQGRLREAYLPLGAVIATAKLSDVWKIDRPDAAEKWGLDPDEVAFGDYSRGRYAWFLRDIEPLSEPIPAKGALGLWTWSKGQS